MGNGKEQNVFLFLAPLTKEIYTLLSNTGFIHTADYNHILDVFPFPFHQGQDLGDTMRTIVVHEKERILFVEAMRSLANGLLLSTSFTATSSSPTICVKSEFEAIENACFQLSTTATNYEESISKRRKEILKRHLIINKIVPTSPCVGKKSTVVIDSMKKWGSEQKLLVQCKLLCRTLLSQCKRQMDWEASVIHDVIHLLKDGFIYTKRNIFHSYGIEYSRAGTIHSNYPHLAHRLREWARGIEEHLLLDEELWVAAKVFLQNSIDEFAYNFEGNLKMTYGSLLSKKDTRIGTKAFLRNIEGLVRLSDNNNGNVLTDNSDDINRNFKTKQDMKKSLKDKIQQCSSIQEAVDIFIDHDSELKCRSDCWGTDIISYGSERVRGKDGAKNTSLLLLVGPPGSGKTHTFDLIQHNVTKIRPSSICPNDRVKESVVKVGPQRTVTDVTIIRPRLLVDFPGAYVGSCEDTLLSLFANAEGKMVQNQKYVILLDDIERLISEYNYEVGDNSDGGANDIYDNEQHILTRTRSMFLTLIDHFKLIYGECIILCSTKSIDVGVLERFDKIFYLEEIRSIDCKYIIEKHLNLNNTLFNSQIHNLMASTIESTFGRSRGEVAFFCREVLNQIPSSQNRDKEHVVYEKRLLLIKEYQSILPNSIRDASRDGFVVMNTLTSRELRADITFNQDGRESFPLLGRNAQESWQQISNIIIAPLCFSETLVNLLYRTNQRPSQSMVTGILLTGKPGSGKTTIAYHCAVVAAGIDPTIRVLDVSCTSLIHKELGKTERAIKRLFDTARAASPCILILDGIENIAPVRGKHITTEGTIDRMLSTLLTEMDGITSTYRTKCTRIAAIGITSRPNAIDPALRRPGRLEKCINLENPISRL